MPDLRGFGESDRQARAAGRRLLGRRAGAQRGRPDRRLGLAPPVIAGYDIGSRIAQAIARDTPEKLARARRLAAGGAGRAHPDPRERMREFWYQSFHEVTLIEEILDGDRAAVRAYLAALLEPLVGPGLRRPPTRDLDRLADALRARRARSPPRSAGTAPARARSRRALAETAAGARSGSPRRRTVLWPEHDPLFPRAWSDRARRVLQRRRPALDLDGAGHFTPVEAPEAFAAAIRGRLQE